MNRVHKLFSIFRFFIQAVFFKKITGINLIYSNVELIGISDISIGKNNILKQYSRISVDYKSNDQYIMIGNSNTFDCMSVIRTQGGNIAIGNNNYFGDRCQIMGLGNVEVKDNCMIAANVFISSSNHDYSNPQSDNYLLKEIGKKTTIGNHVCIGANSVILAGISIGNYSIVGAGSVVTKDIPDYHIAVGNPCKLIKRYDIDEKKWDNF